MRERIFEKEGYYNIEIDKEANVLYLNVFGAWKKSEEVPDYLTHIQEALKHFEPGFKCFTSIIDEKPPSLETGKLQQTCMKYIMNAEPFKVGVYLPKGKGKMLQTLSLKVFQKLTSFNFEIFNDIKKVEQFLEL